MKDEAIPPLSEEKHQSGNTDYKVPAKSKKATVKKESVKRCKVIVRYVQITEEERKIKRAIIEGIMKKRY